MIDCALYVRNSTDKQEHSAENQKEVLTEYAKKNKYNIVKTYADEGISGTRAEKRPNFMQMIEDSASGLFSAVLIFDSSRFARNLQESLVYKSILKNNNVKLVSITEPNLDDESALLTDALLGAMNEMFSIKLSKNVIRGMEYMAQNGEFPVPPPYGYVKINGVMTVVEKEAKLVRKIYEMYLERPVYHAVTVAINEEGYTTRKGYKWASRDIKRIVTNPAYIGYIRYRGKDYKGTHEPIITEELYDKVQKIIKNMPKRQMRPANTVKHWLSGLLKCSKCGATLVCITPKKGGPFFRCHSQAVGKCDVSNFTPVHMAERIIISALQELSASSNINMEYLNYTLKAANADKKTSLEEALKKLEARLERHKEAYALGVDTIEEYKANKEICDKDIQTVKLNLASLKIDDIEGKLAAFQKNSAEFLQSLKNDGLSIEAKNIAAKAIISKIEIDRKTNEFRIFYFL